MSKQLEHHNTTFSSLSSDIVVMLDGVELPANIGMSFRVAEGLGVRTMIIAGDQEQLSSKKIKRVARSTIDRISYDVKPNLLESIASYKALGYRVYAIELTENAIDLRKVDFSNVENVVFILGAENFGVSTEVLDLCDGEIAIPMFGSNSSFNVVTALSMSLFEYVRQITNQPN